MNYLKIFIANNIPVRNKFQLIDCISNKLRFIKSQKRRKSNICNMSLPDASL